MNYLDDLNQIKSTVKEKGSCYACEEKFEIGDDVVISNEGYSYHDGCYTSGITQRSEMAFEFTIE